MDCISYKIGSDIMSLAMTSDMTFRVVGLIDESDLIEVSLLLTDNHGKKSEHVLTFARIGDSKEFKRYWDHDDIGTKHFSVYDESALFFELSHLLRDRELETTITGYWIFCNEREENDFLTFEDLI